MSWKRFFTKGKIVVYIFILGAGGFAASRIFGGNKTDNILTGPARRQDVKRTVLATGQVVSNTDLSLSFKSSGRVRTVSAKVGAIVQTGTILAALDQGAELAAVKSAQGGLVSAEANYKKVLEGTRSQEVAVSEAAVRVAEVTLDNARKSLADTTLKQDVLVDNAYRALLNTSLSARAVSLYDTDLTVSISGIYLGSQEGVINVKLMPTGNVSFYYGASGLASYTGIVEQGKALPLGDSGLFITFGTKGNLKLSDAWVVEIPNKQSSSYVTNYNAYRSSWDTRTSAVADGQAAVASAEAALELRRAELDLKKASAQPSEVEAARAQVLSAEGQVLSATSALENTVIRAPAAGTVTRVDVKPGELASALASVIVLQDLKSLYVEANISEANIAGIKAGQKVEVTFDALGADKVFQATVRFVEPAPTVVSGVVNYKIKAGLAKTPEMLIGMTANLNVLVEEKSSVLVIPARAIVNRSEKKYVRVITEPQTKAYEEREIEIGIYADGGFVEITKGLEEGQEIVTFINKQ